MGSFQLICTKCGSPASPVDWACQSCHGPLKIVDKQPFEQALVSQERSLWRYSKMLAYVGKDIVTLGEGKTPTIKLDKNLFLKLDYLNPTGSFKDRGSTVAITTHIGLRGKASMVHEDSSGNAGASMAAYCARAGIPITIYVPKTSSGRKLEQIRSYGARLVLVEGPRDEAAKQAQRAPGVYLGHVWNPFFLEGMKTLAFEIAEEFNWQPPEIIYTPTSVGTILLGLIYGFEELLNSGVVNEMPRIVAVQPRNVSPLYHLFKGLPYDVPESSRSIADAIVSHSPPRLQEMVSALGRAGGDCLVLDEGEIISYTRDLARKGIYVEPSGALGYGAYMKENRLRSINRISLVLLTGIGLKVAPS